MDAPEPRRWRDLRADGLSRRRLDGPDWERPLRGVRTPSCLDRDDATVRIQEALAACPPDAVLTGWASAYALGARDLDGRDWVTGRRLPVRVNVGPTGKVRPRPGLVTDRSALRPFDVVEHEGLLVARPAVTAWQLIRTGSLEDSVVAIDAMLRAGVLARRDLADQVRRSSRHRGVVQARQALELADQGTRSSPETRLRLVWLLEAGLPRPVCNAVVLDGAGETAGLPDLLDPECGLAAEYDGAGHRDPAQHAADNDREERFESLGLVVVRAGHLDLRWPNRGRLVRRLLDGYRRARETPARARRWRLLAA